MEDVVASCNPPARKDEAERHLGAVGGTVGHADRSARLIWSELAGVVPASKPRKVMAMLLATNVQLVADVIRADESSRGQVMRAIAATRSLEMIVEDNPGWIH
jgi:hypothetical protein